MPRVSLEYVEYYHLPLLSVKDYIEHFYEEYGALLTKQQVYLSIRKDMVDYVKDEGLLYVVINEKSMHNRPITTRMYFKDKSRRTKNKWVKGNKFPSP